MEMIIHFVLNSTHLPVLEWNQLGVVYGVSVFLNLVCKNFIGTFASVFILEIGQWCLSVCLSLWFDFQGSLPSLNNLIDTGFFFF